MNKKLMTMLVACALSVSALSTTAVFAADAVRTPTVNETTTTSETKSGAYEPEITVNTSKWTGDSDIVFETDDRTVYFAEIRVYDAAGSRRAAEYIEPKEEVNEQGKSKFTFNKDALKNAKIWTGYDKPLIAIDWTKYSKIEFVFGFGLDDDLKSMYVEISVKAPEVTVTPTTPAKPSTPEKPSEPTTPSKPSDDKGATTITPNAPASKDDKKTNTTTTTKKEAPKTGDTMNVALYASLLVVSALFAVVLTTKKRITE